MANRKSNRGVAVKIITPEVEKFLQEIELRPYLFDPSSSGYNNRDLRRSAWNEIGILCEPELTGDQAKKKYESLRDVYTRKKNKPIPSGSGAVKEANKEFMTRLSFLDRFTKRRNTGGNFDSQLEEKDEENGHRTDTSDSEDFASIVDSDGGEPMQSPSPSVKKLKTKKTKRTLDDELREKIIKMVDAPNDEDEIYGMAIANDVKKLSPRKKAFAKAKIQQALFEATMLNHQDSIPSTSSNESGMNNQFSFINY